MRLITICFALLFAMSSAAFERINVSTSGVQANVEGFFSEVAADGRWVIFESRATNLIATDINGVGDIFLRNRDLGTTELLSTAVGGGQAFGGISTNPYLAADKGFATFSSNSTNLVIGDTNSSTDAFVRDLATGSIERISIHSDGTQGNSASLPSGISADGRFVLFKSFADNLVDDDTNTTPDMFVRDRTLGTTERANVSSSGAEGNQAQVPDVFLQLGFGDISDDGRYVAFPTIASDLVPADTNNNTDIFLRDRSTGTTTRISVAADGSEGDKDTRTVKLSADGRFAAMGSLADNLVTVDTNTFTTDIFLRNIETGEMTLINRNPAGVQSINNSLGDISGDGRYIVWTTTTTNLVANDPVTEPNVSDVYVYAVETRAIARITSGTSTAQASSRPTISADGAVIAFRSGITNLVANDTNELNDYFVVDNPLFEPALPASARQIPLMPQLVALFFAAALFMLAVARIPNRRQGMRC